MNIFDRLSAVVRLLVMFVVVAILATLALAFWPQEDRRSLTAYFPRTVSLYEGSDVRILGVKVGEVETVAPEGTSVRVEMWYDAEVKVPENVKAAIISPSIVGDRFVQLTPAWSGGPTLAEGAVLREDRTATPLELDEIYQSLDDLSVGLGPRGANKDGSLSRLLRATANTFEGQGARFNQSLTDIGRITNTLDNNKEELFSSLEQLARFTRVLRRNDSNIRTFNRDLATVSEFLDGERDDLSAALQHLGTAMDDVTSFVRNNKHLLKKNIDGLTRFSKILVKQRDSLTEVMDVAPLGINNLGLAGNTPMSTLDVRLNLGENVDQLESDPAVVLCGIVNQNDPSGRACDAIERLLGDAQLPGAPLPRAKPFDRTAPSEVEHIDRSLAEMLGGGER